MEAVCRRGVHRMARRQRSDIQAPSPSDLAFGTSPLWNSPTREMMLRETEMFWDSTMATEPAQQGGGGWRRRGRVGRWRRQRRVATGAQGAGSAVRWV